MRRHRGLTVLETMLAMVVVFIMGLLLMATLATTAQFAQNTREASVGTMLAQSRVDSLLLYSPDDLVSSSGNCADLSSPGYNYSGYKYDLQVVPFDSHTTQVAVTVTSPGGRILPLTTIMRHVNLYGISVKQNSKDVEYVDKPSGQVIRFDAGTGTRTPLALASVQPQGFGADPMLNQVVVGNVANDTFADVSGGSLNSASAPAGGLRPGGIAVGWQQLWPNAAGTGIYWCVDRTNHRLWTNWQDPGPDWKGPVNETPQTGELLGLALQADGMTAWVGDLDNMCLRHCNYAWDNHQWDPVYYRPAGGMGVPLGVACTPAGDYVFVCDPNNLYVMKAPYVLSNPYQTPLNVLLNNTSNGTWTTIALPTTLRNNWPSGIAWNNVTGNYKVYSDPGNVGNAAGVLWVVDETGGLWTCQNLLGGGTPVWTQVYP